MHCLLTKILRTPQTISLQTQKVDDTRYFVNSLKTKSIIMYYTLALTHNETMFTLLFSVLKLQLN
jgi:hypothetical protein